MDRELTCPDCDSDDVRCTQASYGVYACRDCGGCFTEDDVPSARREKTRLRDGDE